MVFIPDMSPGTPGGDYLSKRLGDQSGALDKRIAPTEKQGPPAPAYDPRAVANTLSAKQQELKDWQDTPDKKGLQNLGSLESIVKLGLAVAGGLSGNQSLQQLGAGMAFGTVTGASDQAQEYNLKKQKQIDSLINQVDTMQGRLMSGMMQTPEAFVDAEGNNIVPSETIQDLLALNVPFNPAAILANAKEGKHDMQMYDVAGQLIQLGMNTNNPADVERGLSIISNTGGLGWTPEYIRSLSHADTSQIMRLLNEENEPASVLAAATWASENGVSMLSPGALRLLTAKSKEANWKIDSIDDQIKVDAYEALKWFNDTWLNEKVDGISNRERFKANPDMAIAKAFEENPDAMIKIKKVFPATEHGDEIAKIRTNAMMTAASMLPQMQMYMSGALTGTEKEKFEALLGMAQSVTNTANAAQGIMTLDAHASMAFTAGERYANKTGMEGATQAVKNQIGSDLLSIAHRLAQKDGIDNFFTSDTGTRMKYVQLAEGVYDGWMAGEDVVLPAPPKKVTDQTPAQEVLDTTPEPEVVVEPTTAPAAEITALATNDAELSALYEKASNPFANVKLPEGYQQAMDDFEVFMNLPEDQRAVMYDDPAFQSAIGIVQQVAQQGMSVSGAVELVKQESEMQARLRELNNEKDEERRARLARIPKFAEALEWERQYRRLSPALIEEARKRDERVKRQAAQARNRRR